MTFKDAQQDMNDSYLGGSTGVFVSGLIWTISGFVPLYATNTGSMLTLFFGGMLIHPLSMLLSKSLNCSGQHQKDNPLAKLALETTILLFFGLFIAFTVARLNPEWFYPIMLLTIGARYLMFQTLYGMKAYWVLGASLMGMGMVGILYGATLPLSTFVIGAFAGGFTELVFAVLIFKLARR